MLSIYHGGTVHQDRLRHNLLYVIVGTASVGVIATFALRGFHVFQNDTANVIATGIAALGTLLAVTVAFMAVEETARQVSATARRAEELGHDAIRPVIRILRQGRVDSKVGIRDLEFRAHNYGQHPATSIYLVYWIPWDGHDDPWENLTDGVDARVLLPFPTQPGVYVSPSMSGVEVNHDLVILQIYSLDEDKVTSQTTTGYVDCLYEDILGWWWLSRCPISIAQSEFPGGRKWMGGGQPTRINPPPWFRRENVCVKR